MNMKTTSNMRIRVTKIATFGLSRVVRWGKLAFGRDLLLASQCSEN